MAVGAVILAVQLADVDRGVHKDVALRAARHPSETDVYMMTRVLAYCLAYMTSRPCSSATSPAG